MRLSLSLALLSLVSLAFGFPIQDGNYERDVEDFSPLLPRDPETYPDLLNSELNLLTARQSGAPGPNLSQNFAIAMIYSDNPDEAADFWGDKDSFYYFTLRDSQIMLVDDGSDTVYTENRYYSFANGYNEWVTLPNTQDKWTIDSKTGNLKRNGQTVFALCVDSLSASSSGIQGTNKQACANRGLDFKRIFFRAINRKAQLPSQSALGWFPQH